MRKFLLSLIGMFAVILTANAVDYVHTFKDGDLNANGGTTSFTGFEWSFSSAHADSKWVSGKGFQIGFIKSETKRYIEEALVVNPYITKINKINVEFDTDILTAEIDLDTIYGRINMYV